MNRRKDRLLLEIDLTREVIEPEPQDLPSRFRARSAVRWRRLIASVEEAATSAQVAGLVATLGTHLTFTQAQEIRRAVELFTGSGKPALAWAESYGEMGNGTTAYLLASAFTDVWLQPSGAVGIVGVSAEVTFLRGLLDKVGIEPQLGQRKEFKSAADRVMRTEFTDAHREMIQRLTDSSWEQLISAICRSRGLSEQTLTATIDAGPLLASDALKAGLIDHLGYRDEAYAAARRSAGGAVTLQYAETWTPRADLKRRVITTVTRPKVVALVDVAGEIIEGRSRRGARGGQAGSTTVASELRAAGSDDRVAAVVLRVDSPGGSAVGSDTIWHEVGQVRRAGKPVIVSMGNLAASGGYYIACGADRIVAEPATLTGSIGVVGGKAAVVALLDKVGVTTGVAARGRNSRMFSPRAVFDPEQLAQVESWLDAIYDDFLSKVAKGRAMSVEEVEVVARGRVWTGADAADRGLVDELGGLRRAVTIAKARSGLPDDAVVRRAVDLPLRARLRSPKSSEDPRSAVTSLGLLGGIHARAAGLPGIVPAIEALIDSGLADAVASLGGTTTPRSLFDLRMPDVRLIG